MSKIKIRTASWHVYAAGESKNLPLLGSVFRVRTEDRFIVYLNRREPIQPAEFGALAEAVAYIQKVAA